MNVFDALRVRLLVRLSSAAGYHGPQALALR